MTAATLPEVSFSCVPDPLADLPEATPAYQAVIRALVREAGDGYECAPTRARLAEIAHVSVSTVVGVIEWLQWLGAIEVVPDPTCAARRRIILLWRRVGRGARPVAAWPDPPEERAISTRMRALIARRRAISARSNVQPLRASAQSVRAHPIKESRSSEEETQREFAGETTTPEGEEFRGRRRPEDPDPGPPPTPRADYRAFTVATPDAPLLALPAPPLPTPIPVTPASDPVEADPLVTPRFDWRAFTATGGKDLPSAPAPARKRRSFGVAPEDLQRLAAEGDPVCRAELERRRAAEPPPELPPRDATVFELLEALESHPLRASLVSRTASAIVTSLGDSPQSFTGWLKACQEIATRYRSADSIAVPLRLTLEAIQAGRTIADPGRYCWRGVQNWDRERGPTATLAAQKPTPGPLAKVVPGASGNSPITPRPRA